MQHVTAATGVLTAATAVNVKMGHCVTPSRGRVSARLGTAAGAVRSAVMRAPMETAVSRNACARTMLPATTSQENAHAAPDTLEHCELHTHMHEDTQVYSRTALSEDIVNIP